MAKSCFRVNYYVGGNPKTAFVVAETGNQASDFLGVRDGSAQANVVASPVEVVGMDGTHDAIPVIEPFKAPPEPPQVVSRDEFNALQEQLNSVLAQLGGQGRPVVSVSAKDNA